MKKTPLEREALFPRIDGIQKNIAKLKQLAALSEKEFSDDDNFALAQHNMRLALEGVFNISSHILSRLPGGRAVEYKELALKMGEQKVVPKDFAEKALVPMAGLRNILVHIYSDLDVKRFQKILRDHLKDVEIFLAHVSLFLKHLEDRGLSLR